jgi:hypothetical protein
MLSAAERAAYEAGLRELHASETFDGELEALQTARAAVASLEAEQMELQECHRKIQEEIAALEVALDERTRGVLTARN